MDVQDHDTQSTFLSRDVDAQCLVAVLLALESY